jgi:hypothetical protein
VRILGGCTGSTAFLSRSTTKFVVVFPAHCSTHARYSHSIHLLIMSRDSLVSKVAAYGVKRSRFDSR